MTFPRSPRRWSSDYARVEHGTPPHQSYLLTLLSPLQNSNTHSFFQDGTPDILAATRQVLNEWNHQKIPFVSEAPALPAAHLPSTIPGRGGQVAPGAKTTGHAQIVNAFGTPFHARGPVRWGRCKSNGR